MKFPENLNQQQMDALSNKSFEKPKEELISGWYIANGNIYETADNKLEGEQSKMIWATKEQAEACLAMSQLSQLMKKVNGDWIINYGDINQKVYVIYFSVNEIETTVNFYLQRFLSFKTEEIRDKFLKDNYLLIEKAKVLL